LEFLNDRFRAVSRRIVLRAEFRRLSRAALIVAPLAVIAGALLGWASMSSRWPIIPTLQHFAAYPGCDAARLLGVAPARSGEPGYWPHLDRDRDGIACEAGPK
jgi:hypothetical protein